MCYPIQDIRLKICTSYRKDFNKREREKLLERPPKVGSIEKSKL